MGSSESKITHPSRMTDNREITNTNITPVECVDRASLEEKLNPTSSKRKNESSQKEEDTQKNPAPSGSQGKMQAIPSPVIYMDIDIGFFNVDKEMVNI